VYFVLVFKLLKTLFFVFVFLNLTMAALLSVNNFLCYVSQTDRLYKRRGDTLKRRFENSVVVHHIVRHIPWQLIRNTGSQRPGVKDPLLLHLLPVNIEWCHRCVLILTQTLLEKPNSGLNKSPYINTYWLRSCSKGQQRPRANLKTMSCLW